MHTDTHDFRIRFEEFDLANGLHVILHRDAQLPIVAVNLWYHVGSKNEREGKTGFAHLFEHLMFQGSANVPPNGHFQHVQQAGGTLNGSTSFDRTNYYETLPAHRLELGLWLEADRMRAMRLDQQTLDTQRNVVTEERRSRYDNQPYGTIYEELFSRAYKMAPYKWPTIGSIADITNASLDDVRAFHAMYYRPQNASVCIAGDFEPAEAARLVEAHFGDIVNPEGEMYRPFMHEPRQQFQVRDFVYDTIPLPALISSMHIPALDADDFTAIEILSNILSSGDSSRLHRRMVYEERAAQSVMTFALGLELPGLLIFRATTQPGRSAAELEELFFDEVTRLLRDGISAEELEKAKNRLEASFLREAASVQSRADMLNAYRVLSKDTALVNREIPRIRAVQLEDVQRVAREYLTERNATVLYFLPYPPEAAP
jgi:zinc protease